jgi:hypothetical protein
MSGDIGPDIAAQQLAPFVLPHGVFALNLPAPTGVDRAVAMSRFGELGRCLAELAARLAGKDASNTRLSNSGCTRRRPIGRQRLFEAL